jgi:cellulose synthase/poly-beta-1,6-N-acetylglucosamine synthase-like glycosyltransferase
VRSNRSGRNEGTLAHLREVVALSNGELLVCAAGDDISYPNRVRRLVEAWQATGADAFFSKYDVIDDNGVLIDRDYRFDSSRLELHGLFPGVTLEPIHGASSAYRRSFLDNVPWPNTPILFEDTFLTLTAAYEKRQVFYVDEPLVQYRRHGRSATNAVYNDVAIDVIRGRETAGERYARSILLILEHLRARAEAEGRGGEIDQSLFGSTIAFYRIRSNWIAASFVQRLRALARIRRTDHARWLLARLLGLGSFARLKRIAAAGGRRAERIADRSTTSRNPPAGSR